LDRFRDSYEKILITTNVMARGIDVEQVQIQNFNTQVILKLQRQSSFFDRLIALIFASKLKTYHNIDLTVTVTVDTS
jgi:hypothetical protein